MKKTLATIMCLCILCLSACSDDNTPSILDTTPPRNTTHPTSTPTEKPSTAPPVSTPVPTETPPSSELDDLFDFYDSVQNDVTGRWRLSKTNIDSDPLEYILDYYKNYFKSDNEVHAIINYTTDTTIRVNAALNMLDVTVLQHITGEENDAKKLFTGDVISEYLINIETGELVDPDE